MSDARAERPRYAAALVTYTLVALNLLIYVWDRRGLFGPSLTFADQAMVPRNISGALSGSGDLLPLTTLVTSVFLHGNLWHLLGNLLFLGVFGPGVEQALGSSRFALYYIVWGVCASAAQIFVSPWAVTGTVGASGAIGGVMGAYLILFPAHRIEITIPLLLFTAFTVPAWGLLGVWFLFQILVPQEGVATWAHIGGFLAGMLTVLLLGGRARVLGGRDPDLDFA